jgi:UDP-N-acetylmuramoyl-L-alanyl-D-glutamate--2,6-diaminopimelate ligase
LQKAKSKEQKLFFINKDDPSARYFIEAAKGGKIILFSKDDISFSRFSLPGFLATDFNLENVAAAVSFSQTIDIEEGIIKKALENFSGVPGRMEIVQNEPFKVIIDYAHTPDSLRKVYEAIKSKILPSQIFKKNLGGQEIQSSKLICILGSAGGGRDKWKRPKMGEIATNYCDEIILTNEDPYNENPLQIIKDIESGFSQNQKSKFQITKNYWIILDRQEAIKKAVSLAKKGDVIIITGKGCESWIHVENGKKIPWNEKEAVKKALDSYITKVNA